MTLQDIIKELNLTPLTTKIEISAISPSYGYASDLLSCVMTGAGKGSIWVTLQAHINIVAVAALLDVAAVIITEGAIPDPATIAKADKEGVLLLGTSKRSFEVVGRLWDIGVRSSD